MKKILHAALAGWVLAGGAAGTALAQDSALDKIRGTGSISIGYRPTAAPFSYAMADGKPAGYAIDICQRLVSRIQAHLKLPSLRVNYVPVTAAERFDKIISGDIQLECADTTNSKPRRERVAFGLTYYYASARMLVRAGDTHDSLNQMSGKTIAVEKGSTGQVIAEARQRGGLKITVLPVASANEGARAVASGAADAFITDDISLFDQVKQLKDTVKVVGPKLSIEPLALMLPKGTPQLQELVLSEMGTLFRSGELRQIYDHWFTQPLPGRGYALNVPPDTLLTDAFRRPSSFVADWTVL